MAKGLDYIINLKDGDFGGAAKAKSEMQGLDNAVEETSEHLGGLGKMIERVGEYMAAAFAIEQIVDFGKESYQIYQETAQAQAQIAAGIKSTAGAAGLSLDDLSEQAEKLAHKTLFSPAQTQQAQAIQLSFTAIKGSIFNDAIPAIEDLATRMGTDLNSAALQVDKALQDPVQGVSALQRAGVRLTEAQKETVASMVEQGNVAGAQTLIINELNKEFGGSAEAARKAKGAMGDLAEQTEELKLGFGKLINDGLQAVVPVLVNTLHWMGENKDMLIDIAKVVGFGAGAWLLYEGALAAAGAATALYNGYQAVTNGLVAVGLYYDVARAEGMGVVTAAQWALNVAMEANPIGLFITGVGLLIGVLYEVYEHCETFRAALAGIGEVAEELVPIFKGLGEIILGAFTMNPMMVVAGFKDAYNGVQKVIADGGIGGAFMRGFNHSITESHKADSEKKAAEKTTASDLVHPATAKTTPAPAVKTSKNNDTTTLAGAKGVRNVQVTINKLVEKVEVHTTNLQGVGAGDLKRQLTELLTGAVHDSELALGSQ